MTPTATVSVPENESIKSKAYYRTHVVDLGPRTDTVAVGVNVLELCGNIFVQFNTNIFNTGLCSGKHRNNL